MIAREFNHSIFSCSKLHTMKHIIVKLINSPVLVQMFLSFYCNGIHYVACGCHVFHQIGLRIKTNIRTYIYDTYLCLCRIYFLRLGGCFLKSDTVKIITKASIFFPN